MTVSVIYINPSCVCLEGLHRTTAVETMPNPVVSSSLVTLRQNALTDPVKVHFMISFSFKMTGEAVCFKHCTNVLTLLTLLLPEISQPVLSIIHMSEILNKVKMVIFCYLRGRERNRVGFIPAQFVHALS